MIPMKAIIRPPFLLARPSIAAPTNRTVERVRFGVAGGKDDNLNETMRRVVFAHGRAD